MSYLWTLSVTVILVLLHVDVPRTNHRTNLSNEVLSDQTILFNSLLEKRLKRTLLLIVPKKQTARMDQKANSESFLQTSFYLLSSPFLLRLAVVLTNPILCIVKFHGKKPFTLHPSLAVVSLCYFLPYVAILVMYLIILRALIDRRVLVVFIVSNAVLTISVPSRTAVTSTLPVFPFVRPALMPTHDLIVINFGIFRMSLLNLYYVILIYVFDSDLLFTFISLCASLLYSFCYWKQFGTLDP